jgi:hypothetical protein
MRTPSYINRVRLDLRLTRRALHVRSLRLVHSLPLDSRLHPVSKMLLVRSIRPLEAKNSRIDGSLSATDCQPFGELAWRLGAARPLRRFAGVCTFLQNRAVVNSHNRGAFSNCDCLWSGNRRAELSGSVAGIGQLHKMSGASATSRLVQLFYRNTDPCKEC